MKRVIFLAKPFLSFEVGKVNPFLRIEMQRGSRSGDLEVSQGVSNSMGVSPEPENFPSEDGGVGTVAAKNLCIQKSALIRCPFSGFDAVGILAPRQ